MIDRMYPLLFEPVLKPLLWGGRKLQSRFGKALPVGERVGESWEIVDLPGDQSRVDNGPLHGNTLETLVRDRGAELLGELPLLDGRFPILLKLIDAQDRLSVQVHPDEAVAKRFGARPKTEAWYIIEADPDAFIYLGLAPGVTRKSFEQALADKDIEPLLRRVPVKAGDFHLIPSGTVHVLGRGILLAEIQQASDTTYRLFDWNRTGPDGNPRKLHVAEALEAIHFDPRDGRIERRNAVACPFFSIEKQSAGSGESIPVPDEPFPRILLGLAGRVLISSREGSVETPMPPGGAVLVPACLEQVRVRATEDAEWLEVRTRPG